MAGLWKAHHHNRQRTRHITHTPYYILYTISRKKSIPNLNHFKNTPYNHHRHPCSSKQKAKLNTLNPKNTLTQSSPAPRGAFLL